MLSLHVEKEPDRFVRSDTILLWLLFTKRGTDTAILGSDVLLSCGAYRMDRCALCVVISVILLISAIVILYFVQPIEHRLGWWDYLLLSLPLPLRC